MHTETGILDLRLRRRSLLWYTAGLALYALAVVALYPQFKNSAGLDQLTKNGNAVAALFGATGSLTSPAGWLDANIFENFLPLIILLVCVGFAASCVAGQDEDGVLALTAALPVSRRSILLQKGGALAAQAAALAAATFACALAGRWWGLSVPVMNLAGISVGLLLLGIDFGLLALLIGAATGRRGPALGVTAGVAAASYLISSLAPVVAWLRPARYVSLFYWAAGNHQLVSGLSAWSLLVLAGAGLVLLAAAVSAFGRLDLR